jgi:hypothetical protein
MGLKERKKRAFQYTYWNHVEVKCRQSGRTRREERKGEERRREERLTLFSGKHY